MKCLHDVFTLHRQIWLKAGDYWHTYATDEHPETINEDYLESELTDWLCGLDTGDAMVATAYYVEWFGPQDPTHAREVSLIRTTSRQLSPLGNKAH